MSQKIRPCGRRFCPSVIRILHPIAEFTQERIGKIIGVRPHSVGRQADSLGMPSRYADHYKPVSASRLRQMYEVENLATDRIAEVLGVNANTVWRKAQSMGLKRPVVNNYRHHIIWPADFDQMYLANVLLADILASAQSSFIDVKVVTREARRRGLPPRTTGARWLSITIEEYRQMTFARAMARSARIEQAAFINAELVDFDKAGKAIGSRYARGAM